LPLLNAPCCPRCPATWQELDDRDTWYRLGVEALRQGNHQIVEFSYQKTKAYERERGVSEGVPACKLASRQFVLAACLQACFRTAGLLASWLPYLWLCKDCQRQRKHG
jgi:hypothetical protein